MENLRSRMVVNVTTASTRATEMAMPSAPSHVTSMEWEISPVSGPGMKETAAIPV